MVLGAGDIQTIAYVSVAVLAAVIGVVVVKCMCHCCFCSHVEEEGDHMSSKSSGQKDLTDVVIHLH